MSNQVSNSRQGIESAERLAHALELAPGYPDEAISEHLIKIGYRWARSSVRPRISSGVKKHWGSLIDEWADSDLPLLIRKQGGARGAQIQHSTGRAVVLTDNSPAQWAFMCAFRGERPILDSIRRFLFEDRLPMAFVASSKDRANTNYHCKLSRFDSPNRQRWKLCHIDPVALQSRTPIASASIVEIRACFKRLLNPNNHFLVPIAWSGLGELKEVIHEIREFECQPSEQS